MFDPDATTSARSPASQFPRQPDGERLCLSDYFRPIESNERDVVVLQAVSAGPRAGEYVEALQQSGEYSRMLYVNGLASGTAEALADYAHNLARTELGLPEERGPALQLGLRRVSRPRRAAQSPAVAARRGRDRPDAEPVQQPGPRAQHGGHRAAPPRDQVLLSSLGGVTAARPPARQTGRTPRGCRPEPRREHLPPIARPTSPTSTWHGHTTPVLTIRGHKAWRRARASHLLS